MAGHSKWATTKRQKAVADAKRGAVFTKIGNQIAIAARAGTDPSTNASLAMVLEKARLANMPKANIDRALQRVADKSAAILTEDTYEAYGPSGIGIIIEVATDNKNRTLPLVKSTIAKNGGRLAESGSVLFQFTRKGVIVVSGDSEDILLTALDAGAEDAETENGGTIIYTDSSSLAKVRAALLAASLEIKSAELEYLPTAEVELDSDGRSKAEQLLDALDDLDDVVNISTNAKL